MVQTGCLKLLTENHISEADDIASPDESLGAGAKISSRDSIAKGLFGPARTARARKPVTVVPLSGTGSSVPNITRPTCGPCEASSSSDSAESTASAPSADFQQRGRYSAKGSVLDGLLIRAGSRAHMYTNTRAHHLSAYAPARMKIYNSS